MFLNISEEKKIELLSCELISKYSSMNCSQKSFVFNSNYRESRQTSATYDFWLKA